MSFCATIPICTVQLAGLSGQRHSLASSEASFYSFDRHKGPRIWHDIDGLGEVIMPKTWVPDGASFYFDTFLERNLQAHVLRAFWIWCRTRDWDTQWRCLGIWRVV